MPVHLLRALLAFFTLSLLGACASKPVSTEKPILRKIALIPATEPQSLSLKNENRALNILFPIASLGYQLDSKEKAKRFNEAFASRRMTLAKTLTDTVVSTLVARGYTVEVLPDIQRPEDDPDNVDYQRLKTDAEMILQLRIDDVGLYSSSGSLDYLPRVNIQAKLYVKSIDDSLYDENLYFGVDAKPGKDFMIVADPKYAYPSFEAALAKIDEIAGVFEIGIDALAGMLSSQLVATAATKTRPAP